MLLEAIFHQPKRNWAFAYDQDTIHLRLRAKRMISPRCTP